jgi:pyruvate dehydrogenase E2 component (dihydrolipoamide acetyltransferase)
MAEIVNMPKLGFDMAEGTLVRWVIQEGEPVKKGAVLAEIETDKATVEVESTYDGIVAQHLVQSGEIVPVNTPIAVIAAPGEKVEPAAAGGPAEKIKPPEPVKAETAAPAPAKTAELVEGRLPGDVKASPLARRMAAEVGIDLLQVTGTGPGGRIVKSDIKAFMMAPTTAKLASTPAPSVQPAAQPSPALPPALTPLAPLSPVSDIPAPVDTVFPLNRLRAAIGRRMTESKQQLPHFYVTHEYDLAALLSLRKQINDLLPDEEKVSVNDFIVKAVALTLRQFPNLNASLQDNQVVHHDAVNVGVAVAVDGGLLTVVCRDTDRKSLRQIAVEVRAMAARAREGKVRPDDIEGSTFSVSNLGMFDVEHFIAIINPPEAAILAVGSAREVPVIQAGQVVPGWRMKATISVDHRVSDGAEAARFLQALAPYLEEPLRLVL